MISKPILTIDDFTGMSDKGGTYYIDGFSVIKENGLKSLDESFRVSEKFNSATTNFSALANIMAITTLGKLSGSTQVESLFDLIVDDTSKFYVSGREGTETYQGYVGGISSSGAFSFNQKPDIFQMLSGNILASSSKHLQLIVRGKVKTGSSTTTIIDSAGRNFETLGLSTTAPNNTVCNLKTGKLYTITAIENGDATKDKLTFTAIGGSPNTANDEFFAFVQTKWDLDSGITVPTFVGQQAQVYMARPIRQFGVGDLTKYMILNGNYISLLSNDESTIDNAFKQLPTGYQGVTFEVNSGYVLVSAFDKVGKGHLLYWDGFSDGWNTDIIVDKAPGALENYNNGWVYLSNAEIFFTDGNTIKSLIAHPDNMLLDSGIDVTSPNAICQLNGKFYFAVSGTRLNRSYPGILVFDKDNGLYWFKNKIGIIGFNQPYCIYNISYTDTTQIFITSNSIVIGCDSSLNVLSDYNSGRTLSTDFASAVFLLDFKQEQQVKEVWLNLKHSSKGYSSKNTTTDITVSYGNGKKGIISYGQIGSASSTTTIENTNGVTYPGEVGDEIEFTSGDLAGQRTFITAITGTGASEVWTVSPAVSAATASSCQIRTWRLKKGEQKTISINNIDKPIRFNTNFIGSKMFLEIVVRGNSTQFPVSIMDIQLF